MHFPSEMYITHRYIRTVTFVWYTVYSITGRNWSKLFIQHALSLCYFSISFQDSYAHSFLFSSFNIFPKNTGSSMGIWIYKVVKIVMVWWMKFISDSSPRVLEPFSVFMVMGLLGSIVDSMFLAFYLCCQPGYIRFPFNVFLRNRISIACEIAFLRAV